ncbi:UDP-N-acetylglucosamine 2-epimerase (non-hydrolyzing) [Silvanigrella paludirubra]|uniref:UDP-N-acetylglucosamine 2-epimerase (Non-hydrolyzing) n=1 Tax=Silvanigrella paludirubra TaxID=2499159 RepID=A0A6N6VSR3_9BACT|nr:UDP-N-acetylglucosamine 2-epimerase (non-hydrolyzing) [Silvanigrella paludirubra]KAB8036835.1 UDP-N-acetylglucosamine 2-epimerase (non-hydrolyzing) [Silvanigrella paludirubra]
MKKIITVIGARPQFIKAAPVSKTFEESNKIDEIIVHTGQHYDESMSNLFFNELKIKKPLYNLEVGSCSHAEQTGKILNGIEKIIIKEKPDLLLVYGDTNSTIAGALAASKLHIPVAHVEAGLRSFNRNMPEEVNRIVTDHLSEYLFSPTEIATSNLIKEGLSNRKIFNIGDVMHDSCKEFIKEEYITYDILKKYNLEKKKYVICTIHRAENTDSEEVLSNILKNLDKVSDTINIIFPLHPRTKKIIESKNLLNKTNIKFIDPVGYIEMLNLLKNAEFIITDSGGIQKEGYFLGTQAIVLRNETEWTELVDINWNILVPPNTQNFYQKILNFKTIENQKRSSFYGNGNSSQQMLNYILEN